MLKRLFRRTGNSHGNHAPDGATAAPYQPPEDGGKLIVLTAPLTETIDHAGYFIQMALASLPVWMEFIITLMVGNPGETDEDSRATLDLIYEIERRGLFAVLVPSIFTPLHDTRMEKQRGVTETRQLTPLQWQIIMKCWKMDLRPTFTTWWAPLVWKLGSLIVWMLKLRHTNGPNFKWPLFLFSSLIPEWILARLGKIYLGRPLQTKTRRELIASLKPHYWQYLRADNGDLPKGYTPPERPKTQIAEEDLRVTV